MKRVLCLSGGLDSSVTALLHVAESITYPLFFDYGQEPVEEELEAARSISALLALQPLEVRRLDLSCQSQNKDKSLSPYFVPARNFAFVASAQNYAASVDADSIAVGFVADTDPALFPDATQSFVDSLNSTLMGMSASRRLISVGAPISGLYKKDLLKEALRRAFPVNLTYSCYHKGGRCGRCPSCLSIIAAFGAAIRELSPSEAQELQRLNRYEVSSGHEGTF
jgi:7-cyano-7-deazaguanine synthase